MSRIGRGFVAGAVFAGLGLFLVQPASAANAPPPAVRSVLAAHCALYAISMSASRPGGSVVDVTGKMLYEFSDSGDSWTTNQKFLLNYLYAEGQDVRFDSDYNSIESKSGDNYSFSVRRSRDGELVEEYRGHARRIGSNGAGVAEYTKPDKRSFRLPTHFLFPTAQTLHLIERAQQGDRFFNVQMFDGSDGGGALQVNAVVLRNPQNSSEPAVKSALLESPAHRVRIAFYPAEGAQSDDDDDDGGGQAASMTGDEPDYEMTMTLHDNGVISDMDIDYDEFSVHGRLQTIEPLTRAHCSNP